MKLLVIIAVIISGLYQLMLNLVQYRSASNPTPENLSDVYDAETYDRWKKYSAEHSRLSIISGLVGCAVSVLMLATNVYSAFTTLFNDSWFMQLFSVILLESAVGTVVSVIFSYIGTMKIEEKYGFNRSTIKTFVIDKIRGFIIEFGISIGIVVLLRAVHVWLGNWMILLFAVAIFLVTLVISFLYPILSRVGNKFTPLEDGELKDRLMELLTKHGYTVKAIEVMDASRRTTKLNAYFTGFGKLKTIVLYDNLVNAMTADEICSVFAHELGHGLHRDVLKNQILNFGNLLIMSLIVWGAVSAPVLHTAFGFGEVNYGFAYILLSAGLGLIQPLTSLVINACSRKAEYRADEQAVKEGYGEAMVSALKKLARENFAHLAPSRINVALEYSHPPLGDRINAIQKLKVES
ncbi:MAG: M48 family metallopeptidase [Clostridia bacterium]|nr:M48 family metallopeptidase [Clostridia bacterium]